MVIKENNAVLMFDASFVEVHISGTSVLPNSFDVSIVKAIILRHLGNASSGSKESL
jgi:hypothetical protein